LQAGREGKLLQSRVIRDRLFKELDKNVALRVYETGSIYFDITTACSLHHNSVVILFTSENSDTYEVCGRGQLHLTVLIENMRREGFEVMVGPPTVIEKVSEELSQTKSELFTISLSLFSCLRLLFSFVFVF
jgi:GTP-binding protein